MGTLEMMAPPISRKSSSSSLKTRGSIELETIAENEEATGLDRLKRVTTRLKLTTRRPSILEWKENVKHTMQSPQISPQSQFGNGLDDDEDSDDHDEEHDEDSPRSYEKRRAHIDSALEWIRSELRAMKIQDHTLAMQLMRLRADIQQFKLQKTSSEHQDLIENSAYSVEEESALKSGIYDDLKLLMPNNNNDYEHMSIVDKPLKDMGVTRMNLNRRRFSLR